MTKLFIHDKDDRIPGDAEVHIKSLIDRFSPTEAFGRPSGQAAAFDPMIAARLRASSLLDFDYLSTGQDGARRMRS